MKINRLAAMAYITVGILLIAKARCRAELQSHAANLRANLDQLHGSAAGSSAPRCRMKTINWLCAIALVGLGIFVAITISPLAGLLVASMAGLKP